MSNSSQTSVRILQNEAKCLKCGDQIYSAHRHDFKGCSCGNIFVDGGMSYIRHGFVDPTEYENVSISISEDLCGELVKALEWSRDNGRNDLGTICALFRAIRDTGHEVTSTNGES